MRKNPQQITRVDLRNNSLEWARFLSTKNLWNWAIPMMDPDLTGPNLTEAQAIGVRDIGWIVTKEKWVRFQWDPFRAVDVDVNDDGTIDHLIREIPNEEGRFLFPNFGGSKPGFESVRRMFLTEEVEFWESDPEDPWIEDYIARSRRALVAKGHDESELITASISVKQQVMALMGGVWDVNGKLPVGSSDDAKLVARDGYVTSVLNLLQADTLDAAMLKAVADS